MKTNQASKPVNHPIKLLALTAALAFAFGGVACSGKDDAATKPADTSATSAKTDMAKPAEKSDKAAPAPKAALTVTTVQPSNSSLALKLPANGNVTAWQEASVGAEANGLRLTQVLVNVGDSVKKGQ
ncbi:MAG TPA: hypothetical protein PK702_11220, partial [Burkholderiaceae bacterium]|nr:hypothetical protein [Burkholderiaceae bacterium]